MTLLTPPQERSLRSYYVKLNGALVFTEDWGDKDADPILAIHTAGQSGAQYRHVAWQLTQLGYRVIVPDMPGHGHSEPNPGGPISDLSAYAEFNLALLDRLAIVDPIVIGCSIGGKITIDIAVRAGSKIRAAIAMAADAGRGLINIRALERGLNDVSTPSRTDRTYWGARAVIGSTVSEERREMIARMHCREDPQISNSDLIGWGTHDVFDRLSSIVAPTRLVAGSDDLWIDPASVRRAAEQIPNGAFTLLEGIGHFPMEEMPDFAPVVHAWIQEALDKKEAKGG